MINLSIKDKFYGSYRTVAIKFYFLKTKIMLKHLVSNCALSGDFTVHGLTCSVVMMLSVGLLCNIVYPSIRYSSMSSL